MSVLIKGMEMPHNCGECWIPCTVEFLDRQLSQRPKCCPCFEIKIPHGRLIDADAIDWVEGRDEQDRPVYLLLKMQTDGIPTVIEAEEGE